MALPKAFMMRAIHRLPVVTAIVFVCAPGVIHGQESSTSSLARRVEQLEQANADLDRRIRELETLLKAAPTTGQPTTTAVKWRDISNWRRLKIGMKTDEVRVILGEPEHIEAGIFLVWSWPSCEVTFRDGKLNGWTEPKR